MSGNSLVAAPVDLSTPFSGTFMLESGEALCTAISSGDWVAGGMAAFSLALDGISMALDPIGSLIAMGLGWLMEHIEPLKGWLNDLTGDAGEVAGFASTWQNIAAHLQEAGASMEAALRGLASMQGEAADAFRAFHADAARHLSASGDWAGAIGTGMTIESTIVKMVHDMTRDAISTVVGTAASAALTTVVTLGFGAPVAVAQVTSKVASLAARLSKFVTNLLRSVKQLVDLTEKLVQVFRRLMTTMANSIRNVPSRTPDAPTTRPPGSAGGSSPDAPLVHGSDGSPTIRSQSSLTDAQLEDYLRSTNPAAYDRYVETGQWPADVQIPKDPSVLGPDGRIDWEGNVPHGGYRLDEFGTPIKEPYTPPVGQIIDRYGPPGGRYTSPVEDGVPYRYDERSLPYVEDPSFYHQYEVTGDLGDIRAAYDTAPGGVQSQVDDYLEKWDLDFSDLTAQRGDIAPGFGDPGGGVQIELPLPVNLLEQLQLLREVR